MFCLSLWFSLARKHRWPAKLVVYRLLTLCKVALRSSEYKFLFLPFRTTNMQNVDCSFNQLADAACWTDIYRWGQGTLDLPFHTELTMGKWRNFITKQTFLCFWQLVREPWQLFLLNQKVANCMQSCYLTSSPFRLAHVVPKDTLIHFFRVLAHSELYLISVTVSAFLLRDKSL